MYPIEKFHVHDSSEIKAFVEKHPFATIVASDPSEGFVATHIPLLVHRWEDEQVFRGHVMRDTDHWRAIRHSGDVFVSFLGPHAPVLGSWQSTPRFGGTWNYQAVHVRGTVHGTEDGVLEKHLEELKDRFETSPDHRFSSLPADYVNAMLPLIVCFDIVVSDLKCIFKLSQNRNLGEFDQTVENLRREGGNSALVAEEMELRRNKFYRG